ncbi:MAG: thioredoxin domain-containing protein [Caldilineaceae bacterium]
MKKPFRFKQVCLVLLLGAIVALILVTSCTTLLITPPAASSTPAADAQSTPTPAEASAETTAPSEQPVAEGEGATDATTEQTAAAAPTDASPLVATDTFKGIPVGFTAEGFPFRGAPDAPIVMYEYSDFQCPFCSRYFVQTEPAVDESYVRNGKVRVVFRDFPLAELHPNAPAAHYASRCVAAQGAGLYWEMNARLFQTQSEWNQSTDAPTYFAGLAEDLGVDMTAYNACIASGETKDFVDAGIAEARARGFGGTPSFQFVRAATDEAFPLVGAQPFDQFASLIDTLVAGGTPETAQEQQDNGEIPYWATAEGLTPDPATPGKTMAGDEYRGNPDAKVVVIEFSDFQCPFCRRHTLETQPALDEKFVDTGEIFWVFKHFPLSIHPQAPAAGLAAECAADQGKFWEMHGLLFDHSAEWSISDPMPVFEELAKQLDLNAEQFAACLGDAEVAQRVQDDLNAGAPFVRGTPTFIVLYNGQGSIIPGALPEPRFSEILQQVLDGAAQ